MNGPVPWMPPVDSPWTWVALAVAAFSLGLAKGGIGGMGYVAIVIMATVFSARMSTGVLLLQLIAADIVAVRIFHRHAEWSVLWRVFPPAFAGIALGWLIMSRLSNEVFRPLLGGITLFLAALQIWSGHRNRALRGAAAATAPHPSIANSLGFLAGATTMLANAAGPVMSLYLLAAGLPKMAFIGTAAWFFFVINLVKTPFSAGLGLMPPWAYTLCALMAPIIVAGVLAGRSIVQRISQQLFEWLVLAFAVVGGLRLALG